MMPLLILAAISAVPTSVGQRAQAGGWEGSGASYLRAEGRATATVTILTPALVGADHGAPLPGMAPRVASLTVPGGSERLLLIYDFE